MHRRLQRRLQGTYQKDKILAVIGRRLLYLVIFIATLGTFTSDGSDRDRAATLALGFAAAALVRLVFSLFSYIVVWLDKTMPTVNESITRLTRTCNARYFVSSPRYQIYPRAVVQGRFAGRWFGPRACNSSTTTTTASQQRASSTTTAGAAAADASATTNELVYLSIPRRILRFIRCSGWCCKSDVRWRHVTYVGGLDADRRPHGAGQWSDDGEHGELLRGYWHHGKPTAPFQALETGTGYAFHAVRVAFAHNRPESHSGHCKAAHVMTQHAASDGLTGMSLIPKHNPDGLQYGVASVECSVSGMFFRHLPEFGSVVLAPKSLCSSSNPTTRTSDHTESGSSSTKVPPALWCSWKLISPVDAALRRR
eukprot:18808-Heterococcus_DN1.PRE.1